MVTRLLIGVSVAAVAAVLSGCTAGNPVTRPTPTPRESSSSAERSISYVITPKVVAPGKAPEASLTNMGSVPLEYGNPFTIGRRTSKGWRVLEHGDRCVFTDEGHILQSGESVRQRVGLVKSSCDYALLPPGIYRVTKDVRVHDSDAPNDQVIEARAMFRVRR